MLESKNLWLTSTCSDTITNINIKGIESCGDLKVISFKVIWCVPYKLFARR